MHRPSYSGKTRLTQIILSWKMTSLVRSFVIVAIVAVIVVVFMLVFQRCFTYLIIVMKYYMIVHLWFLNCFV